jgi:hypothetical protein
VTPAYFVTSSGSSYEVCYESSRIRRLSGSRSPTERQGNDGDWKRYAAISQIALGEPVLVVWTDEVQPFREGDVLCTRTSAVVEYGAGPLRA